MKLKYLELYGFKSFAEKTRLTFDSDFIAVVGPNGSGKSNLSDAIRWVLGEQSAKALRGGKMEDVIFSGTQKKSPMNLAQVSIGFDNSSGLIALPYQEIRVTRKVYRSGESEYLINGSSVRRKDVRELFFDTGIGKEGYSIIGQGRIDEILSSRSEDRRDIFEEAAGISKYKYRKVEAQRRLVRTEESLQQVSADLQIKRQEAQLLKKQADNARRGYRLTQELERHELSLLQKQARAQDEKEQNLSAEIAMAEEEEAQAKAKLEDLLQEIEPYRAKMEGFEEEITRLQDEMQQAERVQARGERDQSVRAEQRRFYQQEEARLLQENSTRVIRREALCKEQADFLAQVDAFKQKAQALEDDIRALQQDSGTTEAQDDAALASAREEESRLQERLHYLEYEKTAQTDSDARLLEEKRQSEEQLRTLREESLTLHDALEEERANEVRSGDRLQAAVQREQEAAEVWQQMGNQLREATRRLAQTESQLAALRSQHQVLSNVMENYEGYYRPVQQFLKAADRDPSLRRRFVGVLADLLTVHTPYETAIDVSLGASLQNIVVETEEDAKFLIAYLKEKRFGRITFLPLERIRGAAPTRTKAPEVLCNGADAVTYEARLSGIVHHFLGRTTLVRNIDEALRLSHRGLDRNRIVSLEGDLINAWGSMVGGSLSKKTTGHLLNRKQQLDQLLAQGKEMREAMEALKKEMACAEARREEAQTNQQAAQQEQKSAEEARYAAQSAQARLQAQWQHVEEKMKTLQEILQKETIFSAQRYAEQYEEISQQLRACRAKIAALQETQTAREEAQRAVERKLLVLENQKSFTEREKQLVENRLSETQERLEQLDTQAEQAEEALQRLRTQLQENQEQSEAYRTQEQADRQAQTKRREALLRAQQARDEAGAGIARQSEEKDRLQVQRDDLEKTLFQKRLQRDQIQEQRHLLFSNYAEQYGLSEEEIQQRLQTLQPIETTRRAVQEIKQALSEIGYFHFESIEEYETLAKEVAFLDQQLEDLQKSREDIETLIADLDGTMVRMFRESFAQINEKYDEIFKILFHGGHAELSLDSKDVLRAGIEISAQPPGKKLQTLGLLSGGERSMTAMALLFAIFAIRPTPFCILDEIDAALDEANIGRYVNYLQTLTDQTQFLVVTHRKTTMELADMLYGVTMDDGVSRVLTLRLDEYEEA